MGGRDVLWPILQKRGLRYAWKQLSDAVKMVDDEPVGYNSLDKLLCDDGRIEELEDLYDRQRREGFEYTKRQVAAYLQSGLEDMPWIRFFVRHHVGGV